VSEPALELEEPARLTGEDLQVAVWRYAECRRVGLLPEEARFFAESPGDLGLLRKLVADGCPPSLALRIAA